MKEFDFEYCSIIPRTFVTDFKIDAPGNLVASFKISPGTFIREFDDETVVYVKKNVEGIEIRSNKNYVQTIPAESDIVTISF
ncbi:hypothetical protein D922_02748 [Enterococcus faecalis 06-MB-DW-09]|nr:hypothetical protein D922_02748 [Enterococcus faecalis 06-MB-DW-09]